MSAGLYVGFNPTPERIANGCRAIICKRCSKLTGHYPQQSAGHDVICLKCADDVPEIRRHLDQLAKERE